MNENILRQMLGRSEPLFQPDIAQHHTALQHAIGSSRVLVVGAAGSIGAGFVAQVAKYNPRALHLVDISENNLVEAVRDLRSGTQDVDFELKTYTVAMGSPEFEALLAYEAPYDYVVSFAAMKHVRSERDPFSLMRMVRTNVHALDHTMRLLRAQGHPGQRVFSVSSDKAANPGNLMGATKNLMEKVLVRHSDVLSVASARFANVAFSDGSLLAGFHRRIEKRQPIAAPNDVKRYFISQEEAGQLCLLAVFVGGNREVFVPKLGEHHLVTFSDVAEVFLAAQGLRARPYPTEAEARAAAAARLPHDPEYPCYFSTSDTSGEKPYEEFFTEAETLDRTRHQTVDVVKSPPLAQPQQLDEFLAAVDALYTAGTWTKEALTTLIHTHVPELHHVETGRNLDQKM